LTFAAIITTIAALALTFIDTSRWAEGSRVLFVYGTTVVGIFGLLCFWLAQLLKDNADEG